MIYQYKKIIFLLTFFILQIFISSAIQDADYIRVGGNLSNSIFMIENNVFSSENPNQLIIPTFDGLNQQVHPSVIKLKTPISGYSYWMAITPYPFSNGNYELPSIFASNNGIDWIIPTGLINPVCGNKDDFGCGSGTVADPNLIYNDEKNVFELIWINQFGIDGEQMRYMNSTDGIHWNNKINFYNFSYNYSVAPSLIYKDGMYFLYSLNATSGIGETKPYMYVVNGTQLLNNSVTPTLNNYTSLIFSPYDPYKTNNLTFWHQEIRWNNDSQFYYGVFGMKKSISFSETQFYYGTSIDGITWDIKRKPLLFPSMNKSLPNSQNLYKGSLIFDDNHNVTLWYSGNSYSQMGDKVSWETQRVSMNETLFNGSINHYLMGDKNYTICINFKADSCSHYQGLFSTRWWGGTNYVHLGLGPTTSRFTIKPQYGYGSPENSSLGPNCNPKVINSLCGVVNQTGYIIYMNGTSGNPINWDAMNFTSLNNPIIGAYDGILGNNVLNYTPSYAFNGSIYSIFYWNVSLNDTIIKRIYNESNNSLTTVFRDNLAIEFIFKNNSNYFENNMNNTFNIKLLQRNNFNLIYEIFKLNGTGNFNFLINNDKLIKKLGNENYFELFVNNSLVLVNISSNNSVFNSSSSSPVYVNLQGQLNQTVPSGGRVFIINYDSGNQPQPIQIATTITDINYTYTAIHMHLDYLGTGSIVIGNTSIILGTNPFYQINKNSAPFDYPTNDNAYTISSQGSYDFFPSIYRSLGYSSPISQILLRLLVGIGLSIAVMLMAAYPVLKRDEIDWDLKQWITYYFFIIIAIYIVSVTLQYVFNT
jgi:hypothetical protein